MPTCASGWGGGGRGAQEQTSVLKPETSVAVSVLWLDAKQAPVFFVFFLLM